MAQLNSILEKEYPQAKKKFFHKERERDFTIKA